MSKKPSKKKFKLFRGKKSSKKTKLDADALVGLTVERIQARSESGSEASYRDQLDAPGEEEEEISEDLRRHFSSYQKDHAYEVMNRPRYELGIDNMQACLIGNHGNPEDLLNPRRHSAPGYSFLGESSAKRNSAVPRLRLISHGQRGHDSKPLFIKRGGVVQTRQRGMFANRPNGMPSSTFNSLPVSGDPFEVFRPTDPYGLANTDGGFWWEILETRSESTLFESTSQSGRFMGSRKLEDTINKAKVGHRMMKDSISNYIYSITSMAPCPEDMGDLHNTVQLLAASQIS